MPTLTLQPVEPRHLSAVKNPTLPSTRSMRRTIRWQAFPSWRSVRLGSRDRWPLCLLWAGVSGNADPCSHRTHDEHTLMSACVKREADLFGGSLAGWIDLEPIDDDRL
jgi:hypothetical protein